MRTTTYYNLNVVEGTDIVNPLTVDNPNYETIDEVMHSNAVSGVTLATEIANATVHAITRENSECAVIRFIATSEWKAGDTVTVDGVPVTALLPSGETLPDGAYVINANVLCILTGTNMTVFAERKKTDNAYDIKYNDTNVGVELDIVNSNLSSLAIKKLYQYTLKASTTSDKSWYIDIEQGGYTPLNFNIYYGNSLSTKVGVETFSNNRIDGFYLNEANYDITLNVCVTYMKTSFVS